MMRLHFMGTPTGVTCRVTSPLAMVLAFLFCISAPVLAEPVVHGKEATWADNVLAARNSCARWWQQQLGPIRLGPWHTTEINAARSLREPVDLTATDKQGHRLWLPRPELLDGIVQYDLSNHGINQQRRLPCGEDAEETAGETKQFERTAVRLLCCTSAKSTVPNP